jgi:hypothetical protein
MALDMREAFGDKFFDGGVQCVHDRKHSWRAIKEKAPHGGGARLTEFIQRRTLKLFVLLPLRFLCSD